MSPSQSHKVVFRRDLKFRWRTLESGTVGTKILHNCLVLRRRVENQKKTLVRFQQTFTQQWLHLQTYHGFLNYIIYFLYYVRDIILYFFNSFQRYPIKHRQIPQHVLLSPYCHGSAIPQLRLIRVAFRPQHDEGQTHMHQIWWNPNWLLQSTSECIKVRLVVKTCHVFVQFSTPEMTGLWSQWLGCYSTALRDASPIIYHLCSTGI